MARTRRLALSALVSVVLLAAGCGQDTETRTAPSSTSSTTTSTTVPVTTTTTTQPPPTTTTTTTQPPPTTTTTTTEPPPTTTTVPPGEATTWLHQGAEGDEVLDLQRRLTDLGYWLGTPDGTFGSNTHHAVVALQKVAGIARDGIVGPATLDALARGVRPSVHSSSGRVVEIDLTLQVLVAVRDGAVQWIFDTSTGKVAGTTPTGQWTITREIDGLRRSELGLLYRPKYFHEGVAIHGYTSVPASPASHGCVRVTYPAMDAIWEQGVASIGTPVLVH